MTETRDFQNRNPIFTYLLMAMNVLAFLIVEWLGSSTDTFFMIQMGAKYNPLIVAGEYWRLLTPMFLHFGGLHLLMNMVFLFVMGSSVERIFGAWRFLLIYFGAGLLGTLSSFAFVSAVSAGASGANFGLMGALLYLALRQREFGVVIATRQVVLVIVLNLAFGFWSGLNIDNAGHIGGLLAGFCFAMILGLQGFRYFTRRFVGVTLLFTLASVLFMQGFHRPLSGADIQFGVVQAVQAVDTGDYERADFYLKPLMNTDEPLVFVAAGYSALNQKNYDRAAYYLEIAIQDGERLGDEQLADTLSWLSEAYFLIGEADLAITTVEQALEMEPKNPIYQGQLRNYQEKKGSS